MSLSQKDLVLQGRNGRRSRWVITIFLERPISGTVMVVAIIFLVLPLVKVVKNMRRQAN